MTYILLTSLQTASLTPPNLSFRTKEQMQQKFMEASSQKTMIKLMLKLLWELEEKILQVYSLSFYSRSIGSLRKEKSNHCLDLCVLLTLWDIQRNSLTQSHS